MNQTVETKLTKLTLLLEGVGYDIPNYPYGFNKTCNMQVMIERNKNGRRLVQTTTYDGRVNAPKKSVYSGFLWLVQDKEADRIYQVRLSRCDGVYVQDMAGNKIDNVDEAAIKELIGYDDIAKKMIEYHEKRKAALKVITERGAIRYEAYKKERDEIRKTITFEQLEKDLKDPSKYTPEWGDKNYAGTNRVVFIYKILNIQIKCVVIHTEDKSRRTKKALETLANSKEVQDKLKKQLDKVELLSVSDENGQKKIEYTTPNSVVDRWTVWF